MKEVVIIIGLLFGSISHASEWGVPATGIVDYSGTGSRSSYQTFNVPAPSTVNNPLPDWSKTQAPQPDPLNGITPCCAGY